MDKTWCTNAKQLDIMLQLYNKIIPQSYKHIELLQLV
jgi:hypothetical protein